MGICDCPLDFIQPEIAGKISQAECLSSYIDCVGTIMNGNFQFFKIAGRSFGFGVVITDIFKKTLLRISNKSAYTYRIASDKTHEGLLLGALFG